MLLIDADSQCNLSDFFGGGKKKTLAEVLRNAPDSGRFAETAIRASSVQSIDIIPADDSLMGLDLTSVSSLYINCLEDLFGLLRLSGGLYDFVLIDCPPAFNAASTAALIASDEVIIPIKLDAFSLRGMANLTKQIENMRQINPRLRLTGLPPTATLESTPLWRSIETDPLPDEGDEVITLSRMHPGAKIMARIAVYRGYVFKEREYGMVISGVLAWQPYHYEDNIVPDSGTNTEREDSDD